MKKVDLSKAMKKLQADQSQPLSARPDRAGKKGVVLHLQPDLWRRLKILAAQQDTTLQALGVQALQELLAAHGN